jgi:ketosteroid isomerase-like protein
MSANTEVVERLLRAFEQRDIEPALAELDPDVELVPIRAQLEGASYRGHEGYRRVVADFDEDWEELLLVPERTQESGDHVLVIGRMAAKGKASGVELDIRLVLLFELRNGKVVRLESFSDLDEAVAAIGVED